METLLDTYKKNVRKRSLFVEIIDIDFYDGPTEALCQLIDSEQWFICGLVNFDVEKGEKIFTLLEINDEWLSEFRSILGKRLTDQTEFYQKIKAKVSFIYSVYSGKVFLFKSDWLDATDYEVCQIPLKNLKYFSDVEDVLEQSEESKGKWRSFFSKPE